MIRIQGLTKRFGDFVAVDNLDLEVPNGAIYGLLGPNGAGKSTTLKMMTGILLPDSGNVYYADISMREDPEKAKAKIGFVPDSPDMFLGMKGRDYLAFIASIFKGDRTTALERTKALSEKLNIAKNLDEYIVTYSHGMRQKIFLLGALLHDPDAFILDEPLLRLDSDTFYINHVTAVMVDNLRRLLLGINLSDKAVMDFDFPGVGFPIQFVYQDTVDKLMDVFIGQFLYVAVFPDNLNKP